MQEERRRILNMLAEGKLSAQEAEDLLDAGNRRSVSAADGGNQSPPSNPKYLRVLVEGNDHQEHGGKVNVRVPISLIRAGMRLAALLPASVYGPVNSALKDKGIDIDVSKVKPQDLEDLVQHLSELQIDVEGHRGEKVRVFCE